MQVLGKNSFAGTPSTMIIGVLLMWRRFRFSCCGLLPNKESRMTPNASAIARWHWGDTVFPSSSRWPP